MIRIDNNHAPAHAAAGAGEPGPAAPRCPSTSTLVPRNSSAPVAARVRMGNLLRGAPCNQAALTADSDRHELDYGAECAIYADRVKRAGILAERQETQWASADAPLPRVAHKLSKLLGTRTDQDKLREFVEFMVNGTVGGPPGVRQALNAGWMRYSRRIGARIATLDVKLGAGGKIVDARAPSRSPAADRSVATWRHPSLYRASEADRAKLKSAVKTMLVAFDGPDRLWLGRTASQHADAAWSVAKRRAIGAAERHPGLSEIPLADRIAVALFTRRAHAPVNQVLASGAMDDASATYLRVLVSGLNQLPVSPRTTAYRGMLFDDQRQMADFLHQYGPGSVVTEPRCWSITSSPMVAEAFDGNVRIKFVGNISARQFGPLSPAPVLEEGAYPPGSRFRSLGLRLASNGHQQWYELELLDLGQAMMPPGTGASPGIAALQSR